MVGSDEPTVSVWWVNQFAVPPDQPGGTRHFDMAGELRRGGIDARVVASDLVLTTRAYSRRSNPWDPREIEEDVDGVPFTFLTAGIYSGNDWRRAVSMLVFAASAFVHLVTRRHRRGRTVFIGSSPSLFAAAATWLAARVRRVAFAVEIRDLWPESYIEVTGRSSGPFVRVLRVLADHLYRRADAVIVFVPENRAHVIARGARPERVHVIPNGVDVATLDRDGTGAVDVGVAGRCTFVYAGAHGPANGLDVVVDACRLLQDRGDDTVAVALVGDGPAKDDLVRRAAGLGNLRFWEPVPKAAVPATLRSADAGLMVLADVPLFRSGVSPNKLFDYLACDLPVLTNVAGLVASVVTEANAGVVVAPGDAGALADGFLAVAGRLQAEQPFASGRRFVAERYDRRMLARRLAGVIRSLG